MTSAFQTDELGPFIVADPGSELDYSITCWLEGLLFTAIVWEVSPAGPVLYGETINAAPVTIDGVEYAIGKVASVWIKTLVEGAEHVVTLRATFTGGRKDDRSFRLRCKQL